MHVLCARDPLQIKGHTETESKGIEKKYLMETEMKKSLGSNTYVTPINFKTEAITRDRERHLIMTKGLVQQEDITL